MQTPPIAQQAADEAVTVLYRAHALRLTRLAYVMLGDRGLAEDIVQEAFAGLRRRWGRLSDESKAVSYLRSSVLSGCRTVLRHTPATRALTLVSVAADEPLTAVAPAEAAALSSAERRALMTAVRRLPARQREALALRLCLDEPEAHTAHRALGSRGRRGTGRFAAPLAAVAAVVIAAGVTAALTVNRIDHGAFGRGAISHGIRAAPAVPSSVAPADTAEPATPPPDKQQAP